MQGLAARKRFQSLSLTDVVADVVEAYRPAFDDEGRVMTLNLQDVTIAGDAQLLKRVVANLFENILAHSGAGADAAVADDGAGIAPEGHDRIFERLVRLNPARSKPGHGLGLSMVRAIVHAHGGSVDAVPSETGLKLVIRIASLEESTVP